ncbi:glycoside hydrolase family 99-like domain-containing protein [Burkholderiaceae bacterium DAT-1]|nr:glycoside hydrolase family 99-like domain-containing protein [Burkholderiaceae bacterium DAT-1]
MSSKPTVVAFYLPQYHPIPENDAWWGKGFTEWTNVVRGRPVFDGHEQPILPADLGFYDLRLPTVRHEQIKLAREFGVDAFCFYYYWFGGKRLLETPLEDWLNDRSADLPFCLCWANENWTRRWNGAEQDVLMAQQHSDADDRAVMRDLIRYFKDSRYLRVDGRPVLLVYRIELFPDAQATVMRWKEECAAAGVPLPLFCAVQSFGITDPRPYGFDAAVEFPPHGVVARTMSDEVSEQVDGFTGKIFSYRDVAEYCVSKPVVDYPRFRGVMPSWDNTARRPLSGHIYAGSSPLIFRAWLARMMQKTMVDEYLPAKLLFVNAWNEWGEGCVLEPSQRFGKAWGQALRCAIEDADGSAKLWPFIPPADADYASLRRFASLSIRADATVCEVEAELSRMRYLAERAKPGLFARGYLLARLWVNRFPRVKRVLRNIVSRMNA